MLMHLRLNAIARRSRTDDATVSKCGEDLITVGVDLDSLVVSESTPKISDSAATTRFTSRPRSSLATRSRLVTWDRDLARAAEQVGLGQAGLI